MTDLTDTSLLDLAARCEGAEASEQRELLTEAAFEIADGNWSEEREARFYRMLDAEAYVDSALMLLPDGWLLHNLAKMPEIVREEYTGTETLANWAAMLLREDCAGYRNRGKFREAFKYGDAETPALAILSAILKARSQP